MNLLCVQGPTWQQALQWIEEKEVSPGCQLSLIAKHDTYGISFAWPANDSNKVQDNCDCAQSSSHAGSDAEGGSGNATAAVIDESPQVSNDCPCRNDITNRGQRSDSYAACTADPQECTANSAADIEDSSDHCLSNLDRSHMPFLFSYAAHESVPGGIVADAVAAEDSSDLLHSNRSPQAKVGRHAACDVDSEDHVAATSQCHSSPEASTGAVCCKDSADSHEGNSKAIDETDMSQMAKYAQARIMDSNSSCDACTGSDCNSKSYSSAYVNGNSNTAISKSMVCTCSTASSNTNSTHSQAFSRPKPGNGHNGIASGGSTLDCKKHSNSASRSSNILLKVTSCALLLLVSDGKRAFLYFEMLWSACKHVAHCKNLGLSSSGTAVPMPHASTIYFTSQRAMDQKVQCFNCRIQSGTRSITSC